MDVGVEWTLSPQNLSMFPWDQVDDLWATMSKDVGLIVRAISFPDFQPMWSWSTNVIDKQTDGQTDRRQSCDLMTMLCTVVHRTVRMMQKVKLRCNAEKFRPMYLLLIINNNSMAFTEQLCKYIMDSDRRTFGATCRSAKAKPVLNTLIWVLPDHIVQFSYMLQQQRQHNNTCLTDLCPGLPGWAGTRQVKLIWI